MSTIKKIQVDGVDYDIKASEVEGITMEKRCHLNIPWNDQPVSFTMDDAPHYDIRIGKSTEIGQNVKIQDGTELTWGNDNTLHIGTSGVNIISIPAGFDGATGTGSSDLIVDRRGLGAENGRLYINEGFGALILGSNPNYYNPLIIIGTGVRIGTEANIMARAKIGQDVNIGDEIEIRRENDCIIIGSNNPVKLYEGFNSLEIIGSDDIDWIKRDYKSYELYVGRDKKGLAVYINDGAGYTLTIGTPVEIGNNVIIGDSINIGSDTEIGKDVEIGNSVTISTNATMTLSWGDNNTSVGLYEDSPSLGMSMIITHGLSGYSYYSGNSIVIHKGSEIHSMGDNPLKIKPYETGLVFECGDKKLTLPWETN